MKKKLVTWMPFFLIPLFFRFLALFSEEEGPLKETGKYIQAEKIYSNISVKELILKNGMKVLLKPNSFEKGEVLIQLLAQGGFTLFPQDQRASAELSPEIFFESGFSSLTPDQLSVLLYETNNEFSIKVKAFSRSIEAVSSSNDLETIFKLIHLTFTKRDFDEKSSQIVFEKVKKVLKKKNRDCELSFLDHCKALNSENHPALKTLKEEDLEKTEFSTAVKFFDYAFSNPSDFVMVIVGDFDVEKVLPLLEKYVANLNPSSKKLEAFKRTPITFPKGITLRKLPTGQNRTSQARLTFPIRVPLEEKNILPLELSCQIIETKLRERLQSSFTTIKDLDVAYEFPLYPCLEVGAISIEFQQQEESMEKVTKVILNEIKLLQDPLASPFDLENAKIQQNEIEEYWLKQNDFWLASLSSYSVVSWNPDLIIKDIAKERKLSVEKIKNVIRNYISLDNYTLIWTTP